MSGESHMPTFKFEATAIRRGQTFKATAEAGNKKEAKALAAAALLKKLGIEVDVDTSTSSKEYSNEETAVSYLNRMAQQYRLRMPDYIDGGRKGEDHCPTFKMVVKFRGKEAVGFGSSKKEAKEAAARKLIDLI